MKRPSIEEYLRALEKMKRNPRDRVGILGELGVAGLGVTAGVALSGSLAVVAGTATLAGSTTLASILGGIFVTKTPFEWISGAAIAGGALAYIAGKCLRSGSKCDIRREIYIRGLEERIHGLSQEAECRLDYDDKIEQLITGLQYLVSNLYIEQDKATDLLAAVEMKHMSVDEALGLVQTVITEKSTSGGDDAKRIAPEDVCSDRQ